MNCVDCGRRFFMGFYGVLWLRGGFCGWGGRVVLGLGLWRGMEWGCGFSEAAEDEVLGRRGWGVGGVVVCVGFCGWGVGWDFLGKRY